MELREKNKGKKIAIVAQGPGFEKCPFDKETWGLNMGLMRMKRVDRIFMMDPIEDKTAVKNGEFTVEQIIKKCNDEKIPMVSAYPYPSAETLEPYPIHEIVDGLGSDYFSNTIAYMIAYAIYTGVESIDLWGVNQATHSEYMYHKGCVEFWIGMAVGMGVNIAVCGGMSHVLRNVKKITVEKEGKALMQFIPTGIMYGYRKSYQEVLKDNQ